MKRTDAFTHLENAEDQAQDFSVLLSNLHYTHFFMMGLYARLLSRYGLTTAQSNVLGIIAHFHPVPMALEEVKNLVLEPNADVSRIVGRLVDKGLAVKMKNESNKRKIAIKLTPAGNKLHKRLLADSSFKKLTASISKDEALTFARVLAKLRRGRISNLKFQI